MASDKKISELASYSAIQDTDLLPVVDTTNAITKQSTWANIKSVLATYFATIFAGITTSQTLTNKTLTAPTLNSPVIVMGSDADGDILVRIGGVYARLAKGSSLQNLRVNAGGTALEYYTPSSLTNASYSALGVVQGLTDAATSGIVLSSGVISVNSGTGNNQIVKLDGSAKLPAVNASALTNIPASISKNGITSGGVTGTQTITHGLGRTAVIVRISSIGATTGTSRYSTSIGVYSGGSQSCVYQVSGSSSLNAQQTTLFAVYSDSNNPSNFSTGVIQNITSTSFDIVWTQNGSGSNQPILWEAQ